LRVRSPNTLEQRLNSVTTGVDARAAHNPALTIDNGKGEYRLARLKANPEQDAAKKLKDMLESNGNGPST